MTATTVLPRARIENLARTGHPHLRPIYAAMRDGVGFLMVRQKSGRFDRADRRPLVAIVGDDTDRALGPAGFHAKSLRRLLADMRGVAVISSAIVPGIYAAAAGAARLGASSAIIETRPEQEAAWLDLVQRLAPDASLLLSTAAEGPIQ